MNRKTHAMTQRRLTFSPPRTVSHAELLEGGSDHAFREALYLMALGFGRLQSCREAFARQIDLTSPQFAVLFGTAFLQGDKGVMIRDLAEHIHLAATHVTTEVGRMARKRILTKKSDPSDRRSVLVSLSPQGEQLVARVTPLIRDINDLLFKDISRAEMDQVRTFLTKLVLNSEVALAVLRQREQIALLER